MLHALNGIPYLTGGSSKLNLPIICLSTSLGIVDFRTKWESFVIVSLLPHYKILTLKVPKSNSLKSAEFQHSVCFQCESFLQIHLGDLRRGSRALRSLPGWLRSSACSRRTVPNPRGPSVLASPGEGGISVTNMALGGIFRLALNLFLSHEWSEDRIHSELHVAKVFGLFIVGGVVGV